MATPTPSYSVLHINTHEKAGDIGLGTRLAKSIVIRVILHVRITINEYH